MTTDIAQGPVDVNVRPVAWMTANDWGREPLVTSVESVRDAWIYDTRRVTPLFAVPDGWKLVPVEPTDAMALAALKVGLSSRCINGVDYYAAMLDAAPNV